MITAFVLGLRAQWCVRESSFKNNFALIGVNLDKKVEGPDHGECRPRAYNGGLRVEPQRGPGAEPLVRGSGGEAP